MLDCLAELWTPFDEEECLRRLDRSFPAPTCKPPGDGDPVRRKMPPDALLGRQADDGFRLLYRSGRLLCWSARVQITPSENGSRVVLDWSPWRAKPRPAPTVKAGCLIALLVQVSVLALVGMLVGICLLVGARPHRPNLTGLMCLVLLLNVASLMNAGRQVIVKTYVARLFRHTVSVALQAQPAASRSAAPATGA